MVASAVRLYYVDKSTAANAASTSAFTGKCFHSFFSIGDSHATRLAAEYVSQSKLRASISGRSWSPAPQSFASPFQRLRRSSAGTAAVIGRSSVAFARCSHQGLARTGPPACTPTKETSRATKSTRLEASMWSSNLIAQKATPTSCVPSKRDGLEQASIRNQNSGLESMRNTAYRLHRLY